MTEPSAEILAVILFGLLLSKIVVAILRQSEEATVMGGIRCVVGWALELIVGVVVLRFVGVIAIKVVRVVDGVLELVLVVLVTLTVGGLIILFCAAAGRCVMARSVLEDVSEFRFDEESSPSNWELAGALTFFVLR